ARRRSLRVQRRIEASAEPQQESVFFGARRFGEGLQEDAQGLLSRFGGLLPNTAQRGRPARDPRELLDVEASEGSGMRREIHCRSGGEQPGRFTIFVAVAPREVF